MEFDLTGEQRLLQDTVRAFVDDRILPVAVQNDIDHKLDLDLIAGMAELGILGIVIPEEYGGAGLDFVSEALACEEIERGEAAFRTLISVHVGLNSLSLLRYGDGGAEAALARPAGEGREARLLRADRAGRRLGRGGDALDGAARGRRVRAERAEELDLVCDASPTTRSCSRRRTRRGAQGNHGVHAREGDAGVHLARHRSTSSGSGRGRPGELFFENVEVPVENRIGEEGQGFEIAMYSLDQGRFTVAAGACGVVRACLERSVEYARERETFGSEIGRYQFVQDMIAKMVLGYETSKLLVMQAAWMKNEGKRSTRETSLAKWHATESAFEAAHLAIQVFGSYGYSAEVGIERYFRNARAPIIYEGTTQIHKLMQAEHALGYRSLNGAGGEVSPHLLLGAGALAGSRADVAPGRSTASRAARSRARRAPGSPRRSRRRGRSARRPGSRGRGSDPGTGARRGRGAR